MMKKFMMKKFMRNNFSAFVMAFVLVILSGAFSTAWSATLSGSGTDTAPYKIASLADWKTFVAMINNDSTYGAGKYFELTSDITIEGEYTSTYDVSQQTALHELIVSSFSGTFDGGSHTLTFNYTCTVRDGIAPFYKIGSATIRNLKAAGTISTNKNYAGGIAYCSSGSSTIENCTSSITINSSINGAGWHGGFVGWNIGTLTFTNCVFNGRLLGSNTTICGGFIGKNAPDTDDGRSSASFTDCLFAPAQVSVTKLSTFSYNRNSSTSSFTRAYYTYGDGYANQGTRIYTKAPNDRLTVKITAPDNNQYWAEGSANITGLLSAYALSDANSLTYSVEFDGAALTSGTDYTASITKDGQAVTTITEAGTYTLTITGKGNYAGSFSQTFEAYSQENVPYIDANGQLQHNTAEKYTSTSTPNGDWWYVTGETTINTRIEISGTKHLILCDGATLTLPKGIHLTDGNTLHIYGQSAGTGKLIISIAEANSSSGYNAGIGGNNGEQCGTLFVNGGEIEVTGGKYSAGIGGGDKGNGGSITINGGKVTASTPAKPHGAPAAIGGGGNGGSPNNGTGGTGGTITINGGIVSATGTFNSAWTCSGMGGGYNNNSGTVSLNWNKPTDSIYASSYKSNVEFFLDCKFMLEGTDTLATTGNIGGKTLVPALTVKFDGNGGTGTMSDVLKGASMDYVLPECGFTAPADKEFDCWEIDGTQHNAGGTITMNGNITVKAVWRNVSRTVTFDANGHGTAPDSQTVEHGNKASEPEAPQEEGYTFGGWYKEAGCTNTWDFESDTVTADVTLYAKWTANTYTVQFNANNGTGDAMEAQGFTYDADNTALTTNTYTREGYNFAGWNTQADGKGTDYTDGQKVQNLTTENNGTVTLYAKWTAIEYTITYDLDGGTATGNPTKYTIESDDFTLTNPERDGYTFKGWTGTELASATMTVTIPAGSTGNREYSANWEAVPIFEYFSLVLSGQIGVNFYMYLPEIDGIDYSNGQQCFMSFDISGDKSNNAQVFNANFKYEADNRTYYGYRCYINSLQMADKITAIFTYGDKSVTREYSAKTYLDSAMSEHDEDYDLLAAIKNYGHYAQVMLAEEHNFTLGTDYAEMPEHSTYSTSDYDTVQTSTDIYALVNNNIGGSGITDVTYSLNLDSSTAINIYLTVSNDYKGNVSAYLDGGTVSIADKLSNGTYKIKIDDIPAHKLGTTSTVTINAAKTFTLEISALSYVNAALKNYRDDTKLCDAMTALYKYYEETMKYRAAHGYTD